MQRLFSTFPCGVPGAGLLLLRGATGLPLAHAALLGAGSGTPLLPELVAGAAALLLLIGLWTPFAGAVIAAMEIGMVWMHPGETWHYVHFAALGAALAMLGPGGCSVDARLFGRKYIDIPPRQHTSE